MERELLLALKTDQNSTKKINGEINTIKRFLPFVESFSAFLLNYEVFDLKKHGKITKTSKLQGILKMAPRLTPTIMLFVKIEVA